MPKGGSVPKHLSWSNLKILQPAHGPAFIGIGMAKSGTTWIDSVLRQHPDIWMPGVKELHFFDDFFWYVQKGGRSRYFSGTKSSRRRWRRYLRSELKRAIRYPSPANVAWALRFLFGKRRLETYKYLFNPGLGRTCGEITPEYSVLARTDIEKIHALFPQLKILLVLRNPIDRIWSHAKMQLGTKMDRSVSEIPADELDFFLFGDRGVKTRGEYTKILENWTSVFGRENLFVALHDEIRSEPGALLVRIFEFLGVDPARAQAIDADQVVFEGPRGNLPDDLRMKLQEMYAPEIQSISRVLGRPELLEQWR